MTDDALPTALDLLEYCAVEAKLPEGDKPYIFLSYSGKDHKSVDLLRTSLDPKLAVLRRKGLDLTISDYGDRQNGTRLGEHLPSALAEKMWRCRAAIVFWSQDYVRSDYCFPMELPFLLWRRKHSGLQLHIIRINATSVDNDPISYPPFQQMTGSINLLHIVDYRNPNLMPLSDTSSELMLERLRQTDEGAAKERMARYVEDLCELLWRNFCGVDPSEATVPAGAPAAIRDNQANAPASRGPPERARPIVGPSRRQASSMALMAIAIVGLGLAAGAYFGRNLWSGPARDDVSLALCDAAAMSPDDPLARQNNGGVGYQALDVRQTPACEKAVALAPGNARYAFQLGRLLEKSQRFNDALVAYKRAFDGGNRLAANNLGSMYRESPALFLGRTDEFGCATPAACDNVALSWFAKADDGGNAVALYNMALMYRERRGVGDGQGALACSSNADCDRREHDLLARAAALGHREASLELGRFYLSWYVRVEKESPQTLASAPCASRADCGAKAASALRGAADQGDAKAQFALGHLYENLDGLLGAPPPQGCASASDCVPQAIMWYAKAAPSLPEAAARLKVLTAAKP